jgi:hypothetical protein
MVLRPSPTGATAHEARLKGSPSFDRRWSVSPVYAVGSLNYGTLSYLQPSSILVGRVYQLAAVLKF